MNSGPVRRARLRKAVTGAAELGGVDHAAAQVTSLVKRFRSPRESLGDLDAEAAATLIAAAADVALVLDGQGVVRDVAFGSKELAEECPPLLDLPWVDTVTVESRGKIAELMQEAGVQDASRWRQVNHPAARGGADIPILYSAIRPGDGDRVVAVGRDLRAIAALQQRLVNAQQSMERDYARLRHAETRYRLLFQVASEAVLIAESPTGRILEANPAVTRLLGEPVKRLIGRTVPDLFDEAGADTARGLLATARRAGRAEDTEVTAAGGEVTFLVSASLFRQDNTSLFLVRIAPLAGEAPPAGRTRLMEIVEHLPDGFIVTDPDLKVVLANAAFLDLAQIATEHQALGATLDRWVGRSAVDLNVLVASLREHGSVRHFATILQGEHGSIAEVEVSAVSVLDGERPCFGFTVRHVGRRLAEVPPAGRELPRSVQQMTELVGRVPLKDLIRETTDVIERLCIEAALELTDDNRASAAEMLGLSRQSLYVKLRRYGLGDLSDDEPA